MQQEAAGSLAMGALRLLHSYASDSAASPLDDTKTHEDANARDAAPRWLLFARQSEADAFAFKFTVLTPQGTDEAGAAPRLFAMHELQLDRSAMEEHVEELGIEVPVSTFLELLVKSLQDRSCVDVDVGPDAAPSPSVVLTYKFSATISRKGRLALTRIASALPLPVVALLTDLHATKNAPVLTELQKLERSSTVTRARRATAAAPNSNAEIVSSQESTSSTSGGVGSTDADASPAPVNSNVLKRRHIPTGTVRRKAGPRGAKLAKIG